MPVSAEDRLASKIEGVQSYLKAFGLAFRPQIKTHEIPQIPHVRRAAGGRGINCQKVTEAKIFADAGFDDILITCNPLDPAWLARLMALDVRIETLRVVVDGAVTVAGLSAVSTGRTLRVLAQCDTGAGRRGAQSESGAVALAQSIAAAPGLQFDGLMISQRVGGAAAVERFFTTAMVGLSAVELDCTLRSNGGTPDMI